MCKYLKVKQVESLHTYLCPFPIHSPDIKTNLPFSLQVPDSPVSYMCLPEHLLWHPLLVLCVLVSYPRACLQASRQSSEGYFPQLICLEVGGHTGPEVPRRERSHYSRASGWEGLGAHKM